MNSFSQLRFFKKDSTEKADMEKDEIEFELFSENREILMPFALKLDLTCF